MALARLRRTIKMSDLEERVERPRRIWQSPLERPSICLWAERGQATPSMWDTTGEEFQGTKMVVQVEERPMCGREGQI